MLWGFMSPADVGLTYQGQTVMGTAADDNCFLTAYIYYRCSLLSSRLRSSHTSLFSSWLRQWGGLAACTPREEATRCSPLARRLTHQGFKVLLSFLHLRARIIYTERPFSLIQGSCFTGFYAWSLKRPSSLRLFLCPGQIQWCPTW